jgi:hypothetical protein
MGCQLINAPLLAGALTGLLMTGTVCRESVAQTRRDMQIGAAQQVTKWPANAKRYALIIGIDRYSDGGISTLEGGSNDARMLAETLVQNAGFPSDQVIVLTNDMAPDQQPTRANILRRLSNLRTVVPRDGLLFISFSGHGLERDGRAYLLPMDAQVSEDVSLLEDSAINVESMQQRIRQTRVGQVVIVLDACRSDPVAARASTDNHLTGAYTRAFDFDLRNQDVTAFVTLYATEVGHRAYEYKDKRQGYFTWALVQGLKGAAANSRGEVTLQNLIRYLQDIVPRQVGLDLGLGRNQRPWADVRGYKTDELVIAVRGNNGETWSLRPRLNRREAVGSPSTDAPAQRPTLRPRTDGAPQTPAPVQVVKDQFLTFELQGCRMSGTKVICDLMISSDDGDREFGLYPTNTAIYDDFGNRYESNHVELANSNSDTSFIGWAYGLLVAGVRTRASVAFENVSPSATRITVFTVSSVLNPSRTAASLNPSRTAASWPKVQFRNIPLAR